METLQEATSLKDMINYQEGAVVSRTLIKKGAGTVTVFAFGEGQGLSAHTAPFDALVNILDGEAEVVIDGKSHVVKEGEIILLPVNIVHSIQAISKFKMLLTMIKE